MGVSLDVEFSTDTDMRAVVDADEVDETHVKVFRELYDKVVDYPVSKEEETIFVDRRGYAPELGKEYGRDYLAGRIILFSRDQELCGIDGNQASYVDYLSSALLEKAKEWSMSIDERKLGSK